MHRKTTPPCNQTPPVLPTYPKKPTLNFWGRSFHFLGVGIEGIACGTSALAVGAASGHFFGKTFEGFTTVEVIPRIVHSLQTHIVNPNRASSHIERASTYYLTGVVTPYVLNAVGLVGGYVGAQVGYYAAKGTISSVQSIIQTAFNITTKVEPKKTTLPYDVDLTGLKSNLKGRKYFEAEDVPARSSYPPIK
jgi:hypothetical protein